MYKEWSELILEIRKPNIDVMALTETKRKVRGSEDVEQYIHLCSGVTKEDRAKRRVSLPIKEKYKRNITNLETIYEKTVKFYCNIFWRKLEVFAVFEPNDDNPMRVKDEFQATLDAVRDSRAKGYCHYERF